MGSLLIPYVYGDEYDRSVAVLAVIAWRIPLAVLASIYGSILVARDRQIDLMRNSIVAAAFVVAMSWPSSPSGCSARQSFRSRAAHSRPECAQRPAAAPGLGGRSLRTAEP